MIVQVMNAANCERISNLARGHKGEQLHELLFDMGFSCYDSNVRFKVFIEEYNNILMQTLITHVIRYLPSDLTSVMCSFLVENCLLIEYDALCASLIKRLCTKLRSAPLSIVLQDLPYFIEASIRYKKVWDSCEDDDWMCIIVEFCCTFGEIGLHFVLANSVYANKSMSGYLLKSLNLALEFLDLVCPRHLEVPEHEEFHVNVKRLKCSMSSSS